MMSADDEDAEIGPEDLDRYEKRPNTPPLRFHVELLSSERKRISQAFPKIGSGHAQRKYLAQMTTTFFSQGDGRA